jgi:ABC-type bacteriocin/lantibiotic exporter with double-glycine peptidase domain
MLKKDYFMSLLKRPFLAFSQKDVGEYISFQANDISAISSDYIPPIINLVKSLFMFVLYSIILVVLIDWRIAATLLLASILFTWLTERTSNLLGEARSNYLNETAQYTSVIKDLLQGKKNVNRRTLPNIIARHDSSLADTAAKRLIYGNKKSLSLALNGLFAYSINICAFLVIAFLLFNGRIGIGSAVAALAYIECFTSPLKEILYDLTTIKSISSTKSRVEKEVMLESQSEAKINLSKFEKSIVMEGVSMKKGDFHLSNLSATFLPGKKYAIIGSNGSGKSTILELLVNRVHPDSGSIRIDGYDLAALDMSGIIAILDQDEHIYVAGFYDNATIFDSYDRRITKQLLSNTSLHVNESITNSENLQNTSGGEQRLVSFIRILTQNTQICLLDEPFTGIDDNIASGLYSLIERQTEKTFIIVTHDLSHTLKIYDEIIMLDKGAIVGIGNYNSISKTEYFAQLKANC